MIQNIEDNDCVEGEPGKKTMLMMMMMMMMMMTPNVTRERERERGKVNIRDITKGLERERERVL